jgi:hypothetical protein
VHEDPRFIVIDKPALLPVHASAKFYFNTLTRVLGERFPDEPELQIAHRLDRETSGCLVVARDREAATVIKQAFATPGSVAIQRTGSNVDLSFTTVPLGSYSVQWSSDLLQGPWNTLIVTNVQGTGGVAHVLDPTTGALRFYRVRTPP